MGQSFKSFRTSSKEEEPDQRQTIASRQGKNLNKYRTSIYDMVDVEDDDNMDESPENTEGDV